jgi:hypothetical protein
MLNKMLDLDHTWDIGTHAPVEPIILTVHLRDPRPLFAVDVDLNIYLAPFIDHVAHTGNFKIIPQSI